MDTLTINKKKFVIIQQGEFEKIQLLAAQKNIPVKKRSTEAGRKYAHKLIDKWID
ncbi:MAG: hypothetical protein H7334_15180 [Ferruginibacter sp.]|nr:hypothetical protein [Ferruginibacter sp.]